jgi:hypothetical protein
MKVTKWSKELMVYRTTYTCDWCRKPVPRDEMLVERDDFGTTFHYHEDCLAKYHEEDEGI